MIKSKKAKNCCNSSTKCWTFPNWKRAVGAHYIQGDIIKYLSYLIESFHSLAFTRSITISFYSHTGSLRMDYDPEKCQQIVSNLISNAIKFTPVYGKISVVAKEIAESSQGIGWR